MLEEWKDVPGFYYAYQVSNLGRVRNYDTGYYLQGQMDADGYKQVTLHVAPKKPKTCKIHRLVAEAFHGRPPSGKYEVDHINRTRYDNRAQNLRWFSRSQNGLNNAGRRSASRVKGVRFRDGKPTPWQAYAVRKQKWINLGHFMTKKKAMAARAAFDRKNNYV